MTHPRQVRNNRIRHCDSNASVVDVGAARFCIDISTSVNIFPSHLSGYICSHLIRNATSRLTLRAMLSLDPVTVTQHGYPLLLQSGESYHGANKHSSNNILSNSALAETNLMLNERNTLFARFEYVQKSAHPAWPQSVLPLSS